MNSEFCAVEDTCQGPHGPPQVLLDGLHQLPDELGCLDHHDRASDLHLAIEVIITPSPSNVILQLLLCVVNHHLGDVEHDEDDLCCQSGADPRH